MKLKLNLDSTALGHSGCIKNLMHTIVGDLNSPSLGGYKDHAMGAALLYGVATHTFIDTMYKSSGQYPLARQAAEHQLMNIPSVQDRKKLWLSDPRHLITTCYNVWTNYIQEDSSFDVLAVEQECWWCDGTGEVFKAGLGEVKRVVGEPHDPSLVEQCKWCKGSKKMNGPATEVTFKIPYYEDDYIKVSLCGTIDSIGKFKGGCYAIRDWKTTSSWDNAGYFEKYELSRQLRFYTLACKWMAKHYPDSVIGQVGATRMGCFIDAVFIKPNANDVLCKRSDVFQLDSKDIDAFEQTLLDKIKQISEAVRTKYIPKEGILNGSCIGEYNRKCSFWHVCKSNDNVAQLLLTRDFARKPFDPLKYNE